MFSFWVMNRVFNINAPAILETLQRMKEYLQDAADFFRGRGGGNVLLKTRDVRRLSFVFQKYFFVILKKIRKVILSPTLNTNLAMLSHLVTKTKFIYLNKKIA